MKLLSADFVISAAGADDRIPRDGSPQVALAGRSNVGKSSLINALCRKKIARTSAAPGKTRLVNVYRATLSAGAGGPGRWSVYLVDLPGYGYARGGVAAAGELRAVAESYFRAAAERDVVTDSDSDRRARRFSAASAADPPDHPEDRHAGQTGAPKDSVARLKPRATLSQTLLLIDSRHPGLEADVGAAEWLDSLGLEYHVVATKIDKLSRAERARSLRGIEETFGKAAVPVSASSGEGLDDLWKLIARLAGRK